MLYNCLKIIHIIGATLLLTSIGYSYHLWRHKCTENADLISERIQTQTWLVIVPFAIFQLALGFTMISLKHYDLTQLWIKGSIIGFITAITSWFAFIYFLLSSRPQQYKKLQFFLLILCAASLACMIFFMANKI